MMSIEQSYEKDDYIINIEGTIGVPETWQFEESWERVSTYESFKKLLTDIESINAKRVVVNIRSTGGDVNDALLIYDSLTNLRDRNILITTNCYGYVASAATVIAQAASPGQRNIFPNAVYLIHESTCAAEGNYQDLIKRAELLKKSDNTLCSLYSTRSGKDKEVFRELMRKEEGRGIWLSADEAISYGLADEKIKEEKIPETKKRGLSKLKAIFKL